MAEKNPFVLAVDIGGTKLEAALIDSEGHLLSDMKRLPIPFENDSASLGGILAILDEFVDQAKVKEGIYRGIGLSSCGLVDLKSGVVIVSPNQHWYGVPLRSAVEERFGLPVFAATDTRLAVLGEAAWGAGRGARHFAWVTLGTGFGAALFLNGKLYGGERGFAGAFGHNTLDDIDGCECGCGQRGCIETLASGRALARQGQAAVDSGEKTLLKEMVVDTPLSAQMVFQARNRGDAVASRLVDQLVRYAGIGLSHLVNILDINMIILGGGLTKAGQEFIHEIEIETKKHLFNKECAEEITIIQETLLNSALFGAAANVFMHCGDMRALW